MKTRVGLALLVLVWVMAAQADDLRSKLDAQGRAMLDPIREQALHPREVVTRLHLRPTDSIADVGAGPGFWTVPLAQAVPRGTLVALDIRADYLEVATVRAKEAGLTNVRTRVIPSDRPDLPASSVDVVFLAQVDHYLKDRVSYFSALANALHPSGRLVIVNYERFRAPDLAAAAAVGLHVIDQWQPSPPFFVLVVGKK